MESLEMLANNIANQSSPGFKADREFYSLYMSPDAVATAGAGVSPATLPVIERNWTDFTQGLLNSTGNSLDLAMSGKGFFVVEGQQGPLYTRNGSFQLSPAGVLQTQKGYAVLDTENRPIKVDVSRPVEVTSAGEIRQDGNVVAKLKLVDIQQAGAVEKRDGTYFKLSDPTAVSPSPAEVHQGKLEASNVAPAEATIRLVSLMRQFESLQRAMQLGGEMNRRAVEEVAKVGS